LVGLTSPILETLLKLKANLLVPSDDLRRWYDRQLREIDERGAHLGYSQRYLESAKFALAAIIDETALAADFPLRDEWEKYPLQLEYFREQLAGEKFFRKLNDLLPEVASDDRVADVVELYYACLLMGFRGEYMILGEDQLRILIRNVEEHLRRAGRLRAGALGPHGQIADQPMAAPERSGLPRYVKLWGGVSLAVVALLYIILKAFIQSDLKAVLIQLNR